MCKKRKKVRKQGMRKVQPVISVLGCTIALQFNSFKIEWRYWLLYVSSHSRYDFFPENVDKGLILDA